MSNWNVYGKHDRQPDHKARSTTGQSSLFFFPSILNPRTPCILHPKWIKSNQSAFKRRSSSLSYSTSSVSSFGTVCRGCLSGSNCWPCFFLICLIFADITFVQIIADITLFRSQRVFRSELSLWLAVFVSSCLPPLTSHGVNCRFGRKWTFRLKKNRFFPLRSVEFARMNTLALFTIGFYTHQGGLVFLGLYRLQKSWP